MRWEERSYGGQTFRPAPILHYEAAHDLMVVATHWGPTGAADRIQEHILELIAAADPEMQARDPEGLLRGLAENTQAWIYETINAEEYHCALELLLITRNQNRVFWLQIGAPSLFLWRPQQSLVPLAAQTGHVVLQQGIVSPLPKHFLSGSEMPSAWMDWFQFQKGDRLLLLSRNQSDAALFKHSTNPLGLEELSQSLAQENPDEPFWISWIEL